MSTVCVNVHPDLRPPHTYLDTRNAHTLQHKKDHSTLYGQEEEAGTTESQSQMLLLIKHPYLCLAKERIVHATRNL